MSIPDVTLQWQRWIHHLVTSHACPPLEFIHELVSDTTTQNSLEVPTVSNTISCIISVMDLCVAVEDALFGNMLCYAVQPVHAYEMYQKKKKKNHFSDPPPTPPRTSVLKDIIIHLSVLPAIPKNLDLFRNRVCMSEKPCKHGLLWLF